MELFNTYTNIPLTPTMTKVLVKIMMKLISTIALATKALKQGRSSKCILADVLLYSVQHRLGEICKRGIRWRNGYEGNPTEVGSPYPG